LPTISCQHRTSSPVHSTIDDTNIHLPEHDPKKSERRSHNPPPTQPRACHVQAPLTANARATFTLTPHLELGNAMILIVLGDISTETTSSPICKVMPTVHRAVIPSTTCYPTVRRGSTSGCPPGDDSLKLCFSPHYTPHLWPTPSSAPAIKPPILDGRRPSHSLLFVLYR